jgi:hypothetical protein
VRCQEQAAAWAKDASQLVAPRQLKLIGEVRKNRQRVDEVEAFVLERERRVQTVDLEARERQVRPAPLDGSAAHVAAADGPGEVAPVPRDAAAAAPEVEH